MASTTDPAGMPTCLEYDAADREITKITNCVSGSSSNSSSSGGETCAASDDVNITVRTTYNADGNVATLTAVNSATGDQVTQYIYGTTLADSAIAASTLKRAEIYPDSVDNDDRITFSYNRQGQSVGMRDQNGTVHAYDYDLLGRPTQDRVTTLGSGVDGAVRRIGTTYEVRGMKATLTSYDNATVGSGNVLNECRFVYNDFGQLTTEYESHSGTVNVSTTPKVQYTFANGSSNTIRTTGLVYPNGRALTYAYGGAGSISDRSSRIASIIDDDDTHLCDYSYLGRQTFVEQDDTEPQMKWTLIDLTGSNDPETGNIYSGFDRFGRVKDNRWYNYNSATDVDRIQYGYDRASNRIWRKNTVAAALGKEFDEIYTYDRVHRLKDMARGTLNGSHTALTSETFAQCWTLDPTGNWTGFRQDDTGNGTWDLVQQRSANAVNEISAIAVTTGDQWATPAYDRAGNMTTIPRDPKDRLSWANLTTDQWSSLSVEEWSGLPVVPAFTAKDDAWNRLTKLVDTGTGETIQENEYDGRGYRTVQRSPSDSQPSTLNPRHYYYTDGWQVLEERVGSSSNPDRQFVWGVRYIDDLILRDRTTSSTLDERLYALQDGNWNVTAVVDATGTVQERYEYDPYGVTSVVTPTFGIRTASIYDWETMYAGYRCNARNSHYCVRNRAYLPEHGTSFTRDHIGYAGGSANLLEYVKSRPLDASDPLGLQDPSPSLEKSLSNYFPDVFPAPTAMGSSFDPVASSGYLLPNMTPDERRLLEQATDLGQSNNVAWLIQQVREQNRNTIPFFEGYGAGGGPCFSFNRKLHERIAGLEDSLRAAGVRLTDPQWEIDFPSLAWASDHIAMCLTFPNGQTALIDSGWNGYMQGNLGGFDNIFFPEDIPAGLKGPFEQPPPPPSIPEPQIPPNPAAPGRCQSFVPFDQYRAPNGQTYYR